MVPDWLKNHWRAAWPGIGSVFGFCLWGWELKLTSEPHSMMGAIGFWVGIFFLGWLLGLIWADQTRQGSYVRQRLALRKVIEPFIKVRRVHPQEFGQHQNVNSYYYEVDVSILTHAHKDFENVSARYVISRGGEPISQGPIVEGRNLNREYIEKRTPLVIECPLQVDEVRYFLAGTGENIHVLGRGEALEFLIEATAKGMPNQRRNFSLSARPDPSGRMFPWSSDGRFFFADV